MRKFLAPIVVAAFLCGDLAMCESKMGDILVEAREINDDYIKFYEFTLHREDLTDRRKAAYRNSLRTFMIRASEDNLNNDPNLYEGLQEE